MAALAALAKMSTLGYGGLEHIPNEVRYIRDGRAITRWSIA